MIPASVVKVMTRESRRAQGLPPMVEDPEPLRRIADLIDADPEGTSNSTPRKSA